MLFNNLPHSTLHKLFHVFLKMKDGLLPLSVLPFTEHQVMAVLRYHLAFIVSYELELIE